MKKKAKSKYTMAELERDQEAYLQLLALIPATQDLINATTLAKRRRALLDESEAMMLEALARSQEIIARHVHR